MELQPQYFHLESFQFESGEVLKDLKIEYTTFGRKITDDDGNITNGVLYLHGWSGSYSSVRNIASVIGPGKAVDTNRFFIISPTALGSSGSTSPSTTGLGSEFPLYTVKDLVNYHMKLVQALGIKHLKGVIGTSMGGFQALQWAVDYSDFMDFLIPIATGLKSGRQMNGAYGLMSRIIREDPAYQDGNYVDNPLRALERGSTIGYLWSMTPEYFEKEFETDAEFWEAMEERNQEVAAADANDILWRNKAMLDFNLENKHSEDNASQIRAKTLIIGIEDDQIFPPSISTIPLAETIEDAQLFIYPSIFGHYGCVRDLKLAEKAIAAFLENI